MRYRLLAVPLVGVVAVLLGVLFFGNLNDNLVYYLTPGEAVAKRADFPDGKRFRLGGLVEEGSVATDRDGVSFTVGSGEPGGAMVRVAYRGALAQLFRAGVGVVVEGGWQGGEFVSDTMLVKHDEEYRPPEPGQSAPPAAAGGRVP